MTKKIALVMIIAIAMVFVACTAKKAAVATPLSQADADLAAMWFPGTTLAGLNEAKSHYEANCDKCHRLFAPKEFGEEKWRNVVPEMAHKANVDADTENKILVYVVSMSKAQ